MNRVLTDKKVITIIYSALFVALFLIGCFISYNATQNRCYKKGGKPITRYVLGIPTEIYCEMSNE